MTAEQAAHLVVPNLGVIPGRSCYDWTLDAIYLSDSESEEPYQIAVAIHEAMHAKRVRSGDSFELNPKYWDDPDFFEEDMYYAMIREELEVNRLCRAFVHASPLFKRKQEMYFMFLESDASYLINFVKEVGCVKAFDCVNFWRGR